MWASPPQTLGRLPSPPPTSLPTLVRAEAYWEAGLYHYCHYLSEQLGFCAACILWWPLGKLTIREFLSVCSHRLGPERGSRPAELHLRLQGAVCGGGHRRAPQCAVCLKRRDVSVHAVLKLGSLSTEPCRRAFLSPCSLLLLAGGRPHGAHQHGDGRLHHRLHR